LKRNLIVILVVVVALGLMGWSGYQNLQRRRAAQKAQPHVTLLDQSNQTVQQDVASDEGLPNLRGKKAPAFTLKTQDGRKVSLADYKGKAVLVNFWATWCAPCKIETPWLVELRDQYAAQGFEILGVSADDLDRDNAATLTKEKQEIAHSAEQLHIRYPVLIDGGSLDKDYGGLDELPMSFFVDRSGKVVAVQMGLTSKADIEGNIKKALGN
jgi:peroxiredoxin